MARGLSFLIRYFSNYYTLHRSDLAARAAPLDPRLSAFMVFLTRGCTCKGGSRHDFWKCIKEIFPTKSKVSMYPLPEKLNSFKNHFFNNREKVEECSVPPGGSYLENFC